MKGDQALLSKEAGGGEKLAELAFRTKLLKEDVSEDSEAEREPVKRGGSLKLASFATWELERVK